MIEGEPLILRIDRNNLKKSDSIVIEDINFAVICYENVSIPVCSGCVLKKTCLSSKAKVKETVLDRS